MRRIQIIFARASSRVAFLRKKCLSRRQLKVVRTVLVSNLSSVYGTSLSARTVNSLAEHNIKNHEITASFLENWKYKTACQNTEWVGYDVFESIRRHYGGVIICSVHFGNYYLFPFEIAKRGHDVVVVVGDQHKQLELISVIASNLKLPVRVVRTERGALLRLIRELKSGCVVYILIDELGGAVSNEKLHRVPFLGRTLQFKKGVAALQYYSKLPIVPIIATIKGENSNLIRIMEPLLPSEDSQDRQRVIDLTLAKLFELFEYYVRVEPAQWQKWIDLKRYEAAPSRLGGARSAVDLSTSDLKISKERVKILRDAKGHILIDILEGRYFILDEVGCYAVRLMYKLNSFDDIALRLQDKFSISAESARDYIHKIAVVTVK